VSSTSASGGTSARRPLTIIVAVIGVLGIVVGVLYLVAGNSLPSFMIAGSHVSHGNHLIRGLVCLVVGAALVFFAWRSGKSSASKN
jgi:formate hydrogenlyase subunit 4